MNDKYMEVPNDILTGKDLDYLCDMFQWNYGALMILLVVLMIRRLLILCKEQENYLMII